MKRLLLSIHDVSPHHFERLKTIVDFLDRQGLRGRYAMLVVPDYWEQAAIEDFPDFQQWLRGREDEGVEMILHGFRHRDTSLHDSVRAHIKAKYLSASEGEFLGLSFEAASELIARGKALLDGILNKPVQGFIAPAWLYGEGTRRALVSHRFAFAEDHWSVWSPRDHNARLLRGAVISYASRSRLRILSSLLWSRIATVILRPTQIVRLAIHPHDFDKPELVREIERALGIFLTGHTPVHYADLVRAAREGNS
jgi:uncharacterized protein